MAEEIRVITPWWEDKAVRMVLVFLATLVANAVGRKWGLKLNPEEIAALGVTVLGFVGGHKWAAVSKARMVASATSDEAARVFNASSSSAGPR